MKERPAGISGPFLFGKVFALPIRAVKKTTHDGSGWIMKLELLPCRTTGNGSGRDTGVGVVISSKGGSLADVAVEVARHDVQCLVFEDEALFRDEAAAISLCRNIRQSELNVLWSARLDTPPGRELLREMRLAGCQCLDLRLDFGNPEKILERAREFGFDMTLRHEGEIQCAVNASDYTVAEREVVSTLFPDLHTAQFDLAVAYFRARRYSDVMLPLAKSMTLGFPINALCLNLLACLSAAKHYPEMAAGLLKQARYGNSYPVVDKNNAMLQSWVQSGGDVRGMRLLLEPAHASLAMHSHQA